MTELKMFLNPSFWSKAILVVAVTFFTACSDDDPSYGSLDSDGDGVANGADAFPTNAAESSDADGDGIGDNADNCVNTANGAQADTDADTVGDACDTAIPESYGDFASAFNADESSISYTGQVARQMLILGLVNTMTSVTEGMDVTTATDAMHDWVDGPTEDLSLSFYTVDDPLTVLDAATVSDISSGKNLDGKIAGGDGDGGGETSKLVNDEFFGWSEGLTASATPIDLVDYMIGQLAIEVSDGNPVIVSTASGDVTVDVADYQTDAYGRNWRQLIQKFLLGAVTLSQATNDYLQYDFSKADAFLQEGTKAYAEGEHNWDEAFGYYGAARNGNEFTDDEAVGKTPGTGFPEARAAYANGYNDANADGSIDPRSEVFLGISQNCAKRDRLDIDDDGVGETNMSDEAFDAFVLGRHVITEATATGSMTAAQYAVVQAQAEIAGMAMEKCVAATVIHYINDIIADIGNFSDGAFADTSNFNNYTKHWGEMKGFALGLQFSPWSPFASGEGRSNLKLILSRMGDAPVMPDGTQAGLTYSGGTAGYISMMEGNRTLLQEAYDFDAEVAAAW